MQTVQNAKPAKPPGRGFVISGIVLMAVSVIIVIVAVAVFGSRLDVDGFSRDVAISGNPDSGVPGQVGFRVIESLTSERDTMSVGIAVSSSSTDIDCRILTVRGDPVEVRRGSSGDTFISSDIDASWTVAVVVDDLEPGEYSATCDFVGEPSAVASATFTPGRIVTVSEVFDFAGPVFAVLGGIVVGGFLGLVGLILLIVGLVKGNKARKAQAPPPSQGQPPSQSPPPGWPGDTGPQVPPSGPPPHAPPPGPQGPSPWTGG